MDDLKKHIIDLAKNILNLPVRIDIFTKNHELLQLCVDPSFYLGAACEAVLQDVPNKTIVSDVRRMCTDFVLEITYELKVCLSDYIELLDDIKQFSVDLCLLQIGLIFYRLHSSINSMFQFQN